MRRPPDSTGRSSSARQAAGVSPPRGSSALVPLQPNESDDAPTIITPNRPPTDPSFGLGPGSRLGHFEVIGQVGVGGMAAVLKARDLELNRVVALKILPPQMARDPEHVARFKQEARAAAQLDHDNIARVFFCGEDRGLHFIAFEFVEGDNLRVLIDRRGPIPPAECVRYMLQVTAGLAHAADRGVVHRDVKPSNIIITPDGRAKIVDMGLARNLAQSVSGGVTQSGVTLGTFDYISPEQALDPRRADVRSDIYSLGCAFYHALTGRPPVPEGTAAKKLYAHQHEPVLDPRVLNPAIPDELAAILSKMMAKDPSRRYQSPAELIAALSVLARRLNLGTETLPTLDPALLPPDPSAIRILPQPPRVPISLLAGIAALAVAVAVLLGLNTGPGSTGHTIPTFFDSPATLGRAPVPGEPSVSGQTPPTPPIPVPATSPVAASEEELAQLLRRPEISRVRLTAGRTYDLTLLAAGIVVQGKSLTLEAEPGPMPVVRIAAYPATPLRLATPPPGTLTVSRADTVQVRGVQFVVTQGPVTDETDESPVGLWVGETGKLTLEECRFEADRTGLHSSDVIGLAVTREPTATLTEIQARHCLFGLRRGTGIRLAGRVSAEIHESAFAPHPAVFDLRGAEAAEVARLTLRHCTFLLDRGAVIEVDEGARWEVTAGLCVFAARPPDPAAMMTMMTEQSPRYPVILRVVGDPPTIRFTSRPGEPNAYHQTDALAEGERSYSFEEVRTRWPTLALTDAAPVELKLSPWASLDPVAELDRAEPWRAFHLRTDLPALRARGEEVILGMRELTASPGRKLYTPWPPPLDPSTEQRIKIWWPEIPAQRDNLPRNLYATLEEAIAALRPGDELHIRHTGLLPVPQQVLTKPRLRATIKPEPGSAPILVADSSDFLEPTLFKMVDGEELTLEGLEVRLRPRPKRPGDIRSLSVVTVVGGRQCTLRNCVITAEPAEEEKLAAVILTDPAGEMRTEDDRKPQIQFVNCLIRGKGRALWVQSARPFDLDLTNTATALAGPVLTIEAPAKAAPPGVTTRLRLSRMTALLAGPLLDLHPVRMSPTGSRMNGWVPVEVEADRSLFAALEPAQPLVQITGGDSMPFGSTFTWMQGVGGANWYANYPMGAALLTVTPTDGPEPKTVDLTRWFGLTGEKADRSAAQLTLAGVSGSAKKLAAIRPSDLVVEDVEIPGSMAMPGDAGVEVKQLARPSDDLPGER